MAKPPMAPEVIDQGTSPMFARFPGGKPQGGPPQGNPSPDQMGGQSWEALRAKIDDLEKLSSDIFNMLTVMLKPATALMAPIAQAGAALKKEITTAMQERAKSAKGKQQTDNPEAGEVPVTPAVQAPDMSNNPVEQPSPGAEA